MHKLTKVNGLMIIVQNLYNGNGYFNFDEGFVRGIAASNSYDIINCSYIIASNEKTSSGTFYEYHIPMSKKLFDVLNLTKIRSVGICAVFKKNPKINLFILIKAIIWKKCTELLVLIISILTIKL